MIWPRSPACAAAACGSPASRAPAPRSCPRAVAAFHSRHPHVELGMVEAEPEEAVRAAALRRHRRRARVRPHLGARSPPDGHRADPARGGQLRRDPARRPPPGRPAQAEAGRPGRRAVGLLHPGLRLPQHHRGPLPRGRLRDPRGLRGGRDHRRPGARGRGRGRHPAAAPGPHRGASRRGRPGGRGRPCGACGPPPRRAPTPPRPPRPCSRSCATWPRSSRSRGSSSPPPTGSPSGRGAPRW